MFIWKWWQKIFQFSTLVIWNEVFKIIQFNSFSIVTKWNRSIIVNPTWINLKGIRSLLCTHKLKFFWQRLLKVPHLFIWLSNYYQIIYVNGNSLNFPILLSSKNAWLSPTFFETQFLCMLSEYYIPTARGLFNPYNDFLSLHTKLSFPMLT